MRIPALVLTLTMYVLMSPGTVTASQQTLAGPFGPVFGQPKETTAAPLSRQASLPFIHPADKAALGLADWLAWPYELDGDTSTREWLAMPNGDTTVYRVVTQRNGRYCAGKIEFIWKNIQLVEPTIGAFVPINGKTVFVAQGARYYYERPFTLPDCRIP